MEIFRVTSKYSKLQDVRLNYFPFIEVFTYLPAESEIVGEWFVGSGHHSPAWPGRLDV